MIYEPPWLQLARKDARLGILEVPGVQHHSRILEYHDHTTLHATTDEVPWCASAVCAWLEESDYLSTRSARARSYLRWGQRLMTPALGCIVIIKRGGGNQPGPEDIRAKGHVGLFVDMPTPHEMIVLGGNQSNQVCERTYRLERLLGFRWPGVEEETNQ